MDQLESILRSVVARILLSASSDSYTTEARVVNVLSQIIQKVILRLLKLASDNSLTGERRKLNALDLFRAAQLSGLSLQFGDTTIVNTVMDNHSVSMIGTSTFLDHQNLSVPERPEPHYYKKTMAKTAVDKSYDHLIELRSLETRRAENCIAVLKSHRIQAHEHIADDT